jgi:predicted ATPase
VPSPRRTNILDAVTELVGRGDELQRLEERLAEPRRFVTLLGPPGVGKSRLALAFAAELSPARYSGGIWRCDLDGAGGVDDVRARVAAALAPTIATTDLVAALGEGGPVFLLLDNVEGVAGKLAGLLEGWLRAIPTLTCVATSRERIGLDAESVFPVEPLAEEAAVQLFQERMESARGARVQTDPIVLRAVVRKLDCLPLALELGAAHAGAVEPKELLPRLDPTLPFLVACAESGAPRSRSLREALDGSFAKLTPSERRTLLACSQFRAEFELADAEAVCESAEEPVLAALTRLRERSLVTARSVNETTQFRIYRAAREHAFEALAREPDRAALEARFTSYLLPEATRRRELEGDVRALSWLLRHAETLGAIAQSERAPERRVCALLGASVAAILQGPVEPALSLFEELPLDAIADTELRMRGHHARARLRARNGDAARAREDFERALMEARRTASPFAITIAVDYGNLQRHQGDVEAAQALYDDALRAITETRHVRARPRVLAAIAGMAHERGDLSQARVLFEQALAEARVEVLPVTAATILQNLGTLLQELGERTEAARCFREAIAAHRAIGHRRFEGIAEYDLASLALEEDALGQAAERFERALELASMVGDRREVGLSMALLGVCHAMLGDLERAAREMESAERVLKALAQPALMSALEIHRAHITLAAGVRDFEAGDDASRERKLEAVSRTLAAAPSGAREASNTAVDGDELRFARRILEAAHRRQSALTRCAIVAKDGRWFHPAGGERVDLTHRAPLQRLLRALIHQRMHAPNEPVSLLELIRAGWPEERAVTKAAKNRLHVAITTLRKSGLDPHLVHGAGGYSLTGAMAWEGTRSEPPPPSRQSRRSGGRL